MPRGIYARKPKNDAADRFSSVRIVYNNETDEEIDARISERFEIDRKSTRLNSSHSQQFRMPSSA